jgi:2-oxo-4-hydroxy-4-carboxy-5-ureidoimidazoline decarboxylase
MSSVLASWNETDEAAAFEAMIACCGARRWALKMVSLRPLKNIADLSATADRIWITMEEADWMEAFASHPRIGSRTGPHLGEQSAAWSRQEQASATGASDRVLSDLAAGNALYERQFGFTFIVCATRKSAEEMLVVLNRRLACDRATELLEAAEQQRQIMQIRLGKWLVS